MQKRYTKLLISLTLITVLIFSLGTFGVLAEEGSNNDSKYNSFDKFQQVLYLIKNYHVKDVKIDKLLEGAINGMLDEIDPFSYYMTPDEYEEMQIEFEGHFGGIGIRIIMRDGKLTIVSPIKGTPGDAVGLQAEDIITHVNEEPTSEMTQKEAVDMMRGEPGTEVNLTIDRPSEDKSLQFEITRADIQIPYVDSRMETDNIGYISLTEFAQDVGLKTKKAVTTLKGKGAEAIILDLRSNPGGLLNEAVDVASNFIEKGTIVSVKKRSGEGKVLKTSKKISAVDMPMIVLTNKGSASASEIVAAAIQDYDRGTLVGTRTFGKGTVQQIVPLQDGSAVRLTMARYYTPDNNFIHEKGIEPDVEIKYDPEKEEDNQLQKAIKLLNEKLKQREVKKAS